MRLFLCVSLAFLFATPAIAQVNGRNSTLRSAARSTDTTQRKTADRTHTDRATKAADQASADTELANALLLAMDTDGDGVVTKAEYGKAMSALHKVKKDTKGNMQVGEKAADTNAAAAGNDPTQAGPGLAAAGAGRGNDAMARFTQLDLNHDGILTPDEVPQQLWPLLQQAGAGRNGKINAAEWQAISRTMGDRMRAPGGGANGPAGVPGDGGRKPPQ
jgi:EF hand